MSAQSQTGRGGAVTVMLSKINPKFDSKIYFKVMSVVEAGRKEFLNNQKQLIDIKREHDNLRTKAPSRWFVGNVPEMEIKIVTSGRTAEAFDTGVVAGPITGTAGLDDGGVFVPELGVSLPACADPVRRGVPRVRPGEVRPLGTPMAVVERGPDLRVAVAGARRIPVPLQPRRLHLETGARRLPERPERQSLHRHLPGIGLRRSAIQGHRDRAVRPRRAQLTASPMPFRLPITD